MARRRLPGLSCEAPRSVSRAAGVAVGAAGGCILRPLCPATALGREPTAPPIPHVCLELHMVRVALRAGGPWLRHHEMCSKQAHPGRP